MNIRIFNGRESIDMKFPMTDAQLNFYMRKIEVYDIVPYETIGTVRDECIALKRLERQRVNLDELNYFIKRRESLSEYEKKVLDTYIGLNRVDDLKEMINLTFCLKGLSLISDFSDIEKVGIQLYLDEFGGMSTEEKESVDFRKFAENTLRGFETIVVSSGVFVQHGFEMQHIYDGKVFPCYIYNSDKCMAYIEIANKEGDREFLYLPTDIVSMDKVKARLGVKKISECVVKELHNVQLPEEIIKGIISLDSLEDLVYLNEMCSAISNLNVVQRDELVYACNFVGIKKCEDVTYIAKHLREFNFYESVHNDKEFGKYLVEESDLFEVDSALFPFIDYEGFGASKRAASWKESCYGQYGLVGALRERKEYLNYHGEYADLLEWKEEDYKLFHLYSPLTGNILSMENDWEEEYTDNLLPYMDEIQKEIQKQILPGEEARGLMRYFDKDLRIAEKIARATPQVYEHQGKLYGVLNCYLREELTEHEINILKDFWLGQMGDGWGEGFEQWPIQIDEGELYVSFWNGKNSWNILTEKEFAEMADIKESNTMVYGF